MTCKTKVAIIGSGNIGTDLMIKIKRYAKNLELVAMVGIDPASDGLARAKRMGFMAISSGAQGLAESSVISEIDIVFDATSAGAHLKNVECLSAVKPGIRFIDLTPAAIGPFCVPVVNLRDHLDAPNVNMVTCGGQATIPIVAAIRSVGDVHAAEIVASISSASAGPGTRANIDEFTETTSHAIEQVGGASYGKAIIILNPAEPPMLMRDTVYALVDSTDTDAIDKAIRFMVERVQAYVPGYVLKQAVQFESIPPESPVHIPGLGLRHGTKVTVLLEVTGAAHYLPAYAGNLDIMTSAAMATGEEMALFIQGAQQEVANER